MVLKLGDQVVLSNNMIYVVINTLTLDGHIYHLIGPANADKQKTVDGILFAEEVVKGEELFISPVEDDTLIEELTKKLQKQ